MSNLRSDVAVWGGHAVQGGGYVAGQVELLSKCFQACAMCESWRPHSPQAVFPVTHLWRLWRELSETASFRHLALTGGDPQAYPGLCDVLRWDRRFELQLNTALTQDDTWSLWRNRVAQVRVSLDGATPRTYQLMRGVKCDPATIVERAAEMAHPDLVFNCCISSRNVHEMAMIADIALRANPRKVVFLLVIGDRDKKADREKLLQDWATQAEMLRDHPCPNNLQGEPEDPLAVRKALASGVYNKVRCWTGAVTFHLKCDGRLFPCCLTGGEAILTQNEFSMGSFFVTPLREMRGQWTSPRLYGCGSICSQICQWKQLELNKAGDLASTKPLAMP